MGMQYIHNDNRSMYDRVKYKRSKGNDVEKHPKDKGKGKGKGKSSIEPKLLRKEVIETNIETINETEKPPSVKSVKVPTPEPSTEEELAPTPPEEIKEDFIISQNFEEH